MPKLGCRNLEGDALTSPNFNSDSTATSKASPSEGFQEMGLALEKARKLVKRGNTVESVAAAYLEFAASSPAL